MTHTKAAATRARNLIAKLAAGEYAEMNDATDLMIKINALALKIDRAGEPDLAAEILIAKSKANAAGQVARADRHAAEVARARESHRIAERDRPDAWMRR